MILGGKISIYILNKEKNEEGDETVPLDQIGTRNEKGQLDRSKLGTFVTYLGKDLSILSSIFQKYRRIVYNINYRTS